ncbi:MAG: hypothetical protein ACLSH5_09320 [Christensenellales bacterium]
MEPPTLLSPPSTEPLRRAPLCRACGLWFPEKKGFSTFRWAEGSETDPEPVGMLETPAGLSPVSAK